METKTLEETQKINNALVIIDAQEKIINAVENKKVTLGNIFKLLKCYEILEKNIYITEQNPSKLGYTLPKLLPKVNYKKIEKMAFSFVDNKLIENEFHSKKIKNFIICGFETHICVQQSVLDLLVKGFNVYLVIDAMSTRNYIDHDIAIKRMLSKGATISSTESIIFELCKTSSRSEFKSISNLIKEK